YYQQLKYAFLKQMNEFTPESEPPVPDPRADHGRWQSHADDWLVQRDHLVQVAGITAGQIGKLNAAGIDTLEQLAKTDVTRIPKLTPESFERLTNQARVQLATRHRRESANDPEQTHPAWELLPPHPNNERAGLATMPPASKGDVYFDIEGYPLLKNGLEYLFGATVIENGQSKFHDWWAHDHRQEKASFEAFIDWAYARWLDDPAMHIYHYAPYEVTAMTRLMGEYATREDQVDTLLRNNVFVDLYRVVRQSLLIGGPNYSLKTVEQLYQERRAGDVKTAAGSMVHYANWIESEEPQDWQSSDLLREIRDYNEVDCESTFQLAQWLRNLQSEHDVPWISNYRDEDGASSETPSPQITSPLKDEDIARQNLATELLKQIPDDKEVRGREDERWLIQESLAYMLEFHRREAKPVWWAWFNRHEKTTQELFDNIDCLAGLKRTSKPPERVKQSLAFEYSFDPNQETKISEKSNVGLHATPPTRTRTSVFEFDRGGIVRLKFGNKAIGQMEGGEPPHAVSLIPFEYVDAGQIANAIQRVAETWSQQKQIPEAIRRFLLRLPPKINGTMVGQPLLHDGEDIVEGCIRIAKDMQDSTLCIQGPPGTGKTYTASHMINSLLMDGKKVGITSNSHSAIMNVMHACFDEGGDRFPAIKAGGDRNEPLYKKWRDLKFVGQGTNAASEYEQGLIGGTAWLFANPLMEQKLDYLFVDEAGQVSIANLVGMSRSTNNIVLIGDQMQLGQPSGG
ncbi:TM0106 family RecB-like putative nuclease, partial [bacterium]|nr:TM0106 family RecB-like putative nuclease [bacterium]